MKMFKVLLVSAAMGVAPVAALAQTKAPAVTVSCPNQACDGWYAGVNIGTLGSSADITANGVNSSVFTAGGMLGGDIGWMHWGLLNNQSWFVGANLKLDYDMTGTNAGSPGFFSAQTVTFGGVLPNFFNGPTSPSQGPTQIGPFTAIYPFGEAGIAEKQFPGTFKSGWTSGGGFLIPLGGKWMAKTEYLYTGWNATTNDGVKVNNDQRLFVGVQLHFP